MRKIQKICVLLLAMTMLTAMISGCSKSGKEGKKANEVVNDNSDSNENKQGEKESEDDPLAKYEIDPDKVYDVTWVGYQTAPIDEDAAMLKYWKEQSNINIDIQNVEFNKWDEIMNLKLAADETPDRIFMFNTLTFAKYVDQEVLAEIPIAVLEKYAPNYMKDLEDYMPGLLEKGMIDGKLYGLPTQLAYPVFTYAPIWRKDWLENVGINKIPETLEEAEEAFYKFAKEDPDGNGRQDTYGLSLTGLQTIFMAYGYFPGFSGHDWMKWNWYERDGKSVYGAVQPEMKDALKLLRKWYNDGVIDPEFITGENKGGYWALSHSFVNSKIGYTTHGGPYKYIPEFVDDASGTKVQIGPNLEELHKLVPEAELTIGVPPVGPSGSRGSWESNVWDGKMVGFGAHLEDEPDKLSKLIKFMNYVEATDQEITKTARKGLENIHFKMEDGKRVSLVEKDSELSSAGAHVLISVMNNPKTNPLVGAKKMWADYLTENGAAQYGMRPLLMDILPSESKYKTDLDALVDEAYIKMITTDVDIDTYFDEFVSKWEKAGGAVLTEEANQ